MVVTVRGRCHRGFEPALVPCGVGIVGRGYIEGFLLHDSQLLVERKEDLDVRRLLRERNELLLMRVVHEDHTRGIDPAVEMEIAPSSLEATAGIKAQVLELHTGQFSSIAADSRGYPKRWLHQCSAAMISRVRSAWSAVFFTSNGMYRRLDPRRNAKDVSHHVTRRVSTHDEILERV